ncbi:MAG: GNAT family N-acetyltransferase [Cephaloticoccus sp.]|nr:GNAT family N-acetyltransferase [Cephaloticoccus sp.]
MEVFTEGFSFTRSFTHPYVTTQVGPVRVLRDGPRKNHRDIRRDEWVAADTPPPEVDRIARENSPGRFCLSIFNDGRTPDAEVCAAYKALHYRYAVSEPVMVHPLARIPRVSCPAVIRRVQTQADADRVNKAAGQKQILAEHLRADAPLRQYFAELDGAIVGWVRSITCKSGNWCSNMYVLPKHRRKGIGSALLERMLRDDRAHGVKLAVLTASHAGAKLYATLGYRQIATLLFFTPKKR